MTEDANTTMRGRPSNPPGRRNATQIVVASLQKAAPHLADCPAERVEAKVANTIVGAGIAVFGMLVTGGGLYLLVKVTFTPWLLAVPGLGVFIVLVGGITISKDVAKSFKNAAGIVRELAKAARGKNGEAPTP